MSSVAERQVGSPSLTAPGARGAGSFARAWRAIWTIIGRHPATSCEPRPKATNWSRIAGAAIVGGVCLVLIAIAQGLGRNGDALAGIIFWPALLLMACAFAYPACLPHVTRLERLSALLLLGQFLNLLKLIYSPLAFAGFDEYLHYRSLLDILELHALFASNSLLPVSPLYPGLELVTAAMVSLTGLDAFTAATIFVALARFASVGAYFLLFERVSGSSRHAAIGTLVVMSGTSFVSFHSQYAYETLAFCFFLLFAACLLPLEREGPSRRRQMTILALLFIPAIAVTHHLTSYLTAATATGLALLVWVRPYRDQPRVAVLLVAATALSAPFIWKAIVSAPTGEYLDSHIFTALLDMKDLLLGGRSGRKFFVGVDGTQAPVALRTMGIVSVLMIGAGLFFGFFRALTFQPPVGRAATSTPLRPWPSGDVVLLSLAGATFPATVAFKLSGSSWEVGNRLGTFAMVGVGFVCAMSVTRFFWQRPLRTQTAAIGLAVILSLMIAGGVVNGWGSAVRSKFQISADGQSIEPLGIAVAEWSREFLGEANRIVADRTNAILQSTYGRQDVLSTLNDDPEISGLYFSENFSFPERNTIAGGFVDYVLVDLRLPAASPKVGYYYEPGDGDLPPRMHSLNKFDQQDEIARVLDAGPIAIYDVRKIRH